MRFNSEHVNEIVIYVLFSALFFSIVFLLTFFVPVFLKFFYGDIGPVEVEKIVHISLMLLKGMFFVICGNVICWAVHNGEIHSVVMLTMMVFSSMTEHTHGASYMLGMAFVTFVMWFIPLAASDIFYLLKVYPQKNQLPA